jgi:glycerophosphoryl diester phosphodiesterase
MAYARRLRARSLEIIGHRGSPREERENTLPSFARAFAAGADAVELDVHATADGVVVVHHDPVTNSRSGDTRPKAVIAESTMASLETILIGGASMPTLDAVLASVPATGITYVEIKGHGIESRVVDVIRSRRTPCAVHSFDHRIAKRVHALAPEIPVGILQTSYPIDAVQPMRDAGARDLWQHWELLDAELIAAVHEDGGRVIAWTVNDATVARRLVEWGVDGICSDVPAAMRALADELVG